MSCLAEVGSYVAEILTVPTRDCWYFSSSWELVHALVASRIEMASGSHSCQRFDLSCWAVVSELLLHYLYPEVGRQSDWLCDLAVVIGR